MLYLACIVAFGVYLFAPNHYEWSYCQMCHLIYLAVAVYVYMQDRKVEKLGFHLIFSVAFYFTNFIYPVVVYPIDPEYVLFRFYFDETVITKSTALALFAYSLYAVGYTYGRRNTSRTCPKIPKQNISFSVVKTLLWLTSGLFVLFLLCDGLKFYSSQYQLGLGGQINPLAKYIVILLNPLMVLTCFSGFYISKEKMRRLTFFVIVAFATLILLAGSRTLPLSIYILVFLYYAQAKRLSIVSIVLLVGLGMVGMSVIGDLRSEDVYDISQINTSENKWYDYGMDLIINNRNLYVLYDFAHTHGYTYGISMLAPILSTLPMLQSLVVNTFGIPEFMMSSSQLTTFLEFGKNPPIGLGTNVVGDVYVAFGLIGIICMFYVLGWLVSSMRNRMLSGSVVHSLIYYILAADAIYLCRSYYFLSLKTVVWGVVILWIFSKVYKSKFYEQSPSRLR